MIKLEAEVGPVKYIAALAVDWGVTSDVNTSEAVRWIILIIICVFDPLAVLLLVAANQSLIRRFPVKPLPPEEVLDLEKPDEEGIDLKWNEAMAKKQKETMEHATTQLKSWKDKLDAFNSKVEKPEEKAIEIIQQEDDVIPHIDLKGQKKTKDKEIVPDKDGFSLDEVAIDMQTEIVPPKLFEQEPHTTTVEDALKMTEIESVEKPISERIKPDLTEVIESPRKIHVADMSKLAPEVEVGEFQFGYKPKAIKKSQQRILTDAYQQNEEQDDNTLWQKTKSDTVDIQSPIAKEKFTKYRTRITTDTDYHSRMEQRISDLITNLENGDVKLEDLSNEDQKVIIDILNQ
jgi:hypothetical protein